LALSKENITVTGFIEDDELDLYYQNCKVAVAPLRYGAGVKGKVVDALYHGMPIVTTSVGAEGLLNSREVLMVADDAQKFAKKVIMLYKNSNISDEFSKKELQYIRNNFSQKVAKEKISNTFKEFFNGN
jgi:glycosyltransferase involved in cell wall biosynthesis